MLKIFIYFSLIIVFLFAYVKYIENSRIFFPSEKVETTPKSINLNFEDIYIKSSDDTRINGWFIPSGETKNTMLFFHGNSGNIGGRLDKINLFHNIGLNVFIIDYPGYGKSHGKPSERETFFAAQAAYNYLVNNRQILPNNIIVYGESLGGAAAINLASRNKTKALITEGAFTNLREIGRQLHPFLSIFLIGNKFNSLSKIKNISTPKLIIHSQHDEVIPFSMGEKLFHHAAEPKSFLKLNGNHNAAFLDSQQKLKMEIKKFIESL